MTQESELVLLGESSFTEAKRLKALLAEIGIELHLASDPEKCTTQNCSPKLLLHAKSGDLPKIQEFFAAEKLKSHSGLDFDRALVENAVFDPEKETATCPACATTFSTTQTACPDCGLVFVSELPDSG